MKPKQKTMNLLTTFNAYCRCCDNDNVEWIDKHWDKITETLLEVLPHGSGIDYDWRFYVAENGKDLICTNGWHYMNDNGMYDGSWDFQVVIKHDIRDMFGNIIFKIVGQFGKHQDIKDYLYEIIGYALESL